MSGPQVAMVLAAGLATRMRPVTDNKPKALVPLQGRPVIDHILDRLADAGVERVVINSHWQARQLQQHLANYQGPLELVVRHEAELLETGGAVRQALTDGALGVDPFYVINADVVWFNGPFSTLERLAEAHDPAQQDATLLFHRTFQVTADTGWGDFALDEWGLPRLPREHEVVPYVYAGVQILSPAALEGYDGGKFSLYGVWTTLLARRRLRAIVHDGLWFHLRRPEDIADAEGALEARLTGITT